MTEGETGGADTTQLGHSPRPRPTMPGRRSRLWQTTVTGVVASAFVFGALSISPATVVAQQCPQQQQCPPPDNPPDDPPDNPPDTPPDDGGGGHKQDGERNRRDRGKSKSGRDGGRHGRDRGRPALNTLAEGKHGDGQDAAVTPAPGDQQPTPVVDPPPPAGEQSTEASAPLDAPGPDPVETPPAVEAVSGPEELVATIVNQGLVTSSPTPDPETPAPSVLYDVLAHVRREILDTVPKP